MGKKQGVRTVPACNSDIERAVELMVNLDYYCMKNGQKIGTSNDKNCENNLRKALGVLKEDGVYAMFLWLQDKDKTIVNRIVLFLNEDKIRELFLGKNFSNDFNVLCGELQEIACDLDRLLLMKKLLERTLVYALYHAKGSQEQRR